MTKSDPLCTVWKLAWTSFICHRRAECGTEVRLFEMVVFIDTINTILQAGRMRNECIITIEMRRTTDL